MKFCSVQGTLLGIFLLVFFGIPEKHHYLASAEDKVYRLQHADGPRIILIGDSGVAYGMKSAMIAEEFPGYTVVNMALMAGLGFRNIIAEIEPELHEGDVVVMIFAHQLYDRNLLHYQYWNYVTYRPEMLLRADWRDFPIMVDDAFFFVNRALRTYKRVMTYKVHPEREAPIHRAGFNEYGDLQAHHSLQTLPTTRMEMADLKMENKPFAREVVHELNAFAERAEAKGATVLYMFPPIPETAWEVNGELIRESASFPQEGLEFPIINEPGEMVYPDNFFYDTNYHMIGVGATRRSELLAERLKDYVPTSSNTSQEQRP
ncbi:MAG: hypothetical protein ACQKBV_13250 [Puniceicoccales bacterium]